MLSDFSVYDELDKNLSGYDVSQPENHCGWQELFNSPSLYILFMLACVVKAMQSNRIYIAVASS